MSIRNVAKVSGSIAGFLAFVVVCWSVAFVVSLMIYERYGNQPSEYVRQLITALIGFVIVAAIAGTLGTLTRSRQWAPFQQIIEAIRRIAKGDFSVSLDVDSTHGNPFVGKNNPLWEIASNINSMAAELSQMEQLRQEFISNVSHEIQSPLTSISGFARALQSDELSREERAHYLEIIEGESMRLSRLSENLLKLTSLESEHPPFEPRCYRLDQQLRRIVLSCEPQWLAKSIELDVCLDEVSIVADEDLLSQVWLNVINNSIKFTSCGGTIGVSVQKQDHDAVVRVTDTGIGIAEDDQARIFERFFKADKSRNRNLGGSGLGLAIARKVTVLHQGTIQVESAPGKGTRLTVRLPDAPSAHPCQEGFAAG